jgi:hypothetical protein
MCCCSVVGQKQGSARPPQHVCRHRLVARHVVQRDPAVGGAEEGLQRLLHLACSRHQVPREVRLRGRNLRAVLAGPAAVPRLPRCWWPAAGGGTGGGAAAGSGAAACLHAGRAGQSLWHPSGIAATRGVRLGAGAAKNVLTASTKILLPQPLAQQQRAPATLPPPSCSCRAPGCCTERMLPPPC